MEKQSNYATLLILMFTFSVLFVTQCSSATAQLSSSRPSPATIYVDDNIFESSKLDFISHTGNGSFDSYITMQVPHPPVMQTCKAIEKTIGRKLTNRGEAHITVVTPLEFDQVLKPFLTIEEINKIAKDNSIQESSFDILCIGSGRKELDGVNEETFFFVVESPDLLKIRHKIQEAFEAAGGKKSLFNGNYFFPHITIGFTKRDLHISDQVIKDDRSMDARFRILIGI